MVRAYLVRPRRRRDGKIVVGRYWLLRYKLDGQRKYSEKCLGVADKQVAEEKRRAFIREHESEAAGIIAPKPLRDGAQRLMSEHLTDFAAEKLAVRRASKYVQVIQLRVGRLILECGWTLAKDVTAESFTAWRSANLSKHPKTLNDYLNAACAVLNWMKRRGRIVANPLQSVEKVDNTGQESPWRALADDEVRRLLEVAGPRKAVYLVALVTGLRRNELDQLRWGDVRLDAVRPFLSVRASTTKNGKAAVQWLTNEAAIELRAIRPVEVATVAKVFPGGVPSMEEFRADLASAGIEGADDQGRDVVFHSLRHTLATNLARSNTPPRVAMEVMRHSDTRLTMKVYTDTTLLPTSDAVDRLPRYCTPVAIAAGLATGTDCQQVANCDTQKDTQTGVIGSPAASTGVQCVEAGRESQTQRTAVVSPPLSTEVHASTGVEKNSPGATLAERLSA